MLLHEGPMRVPRRSNTPGAVAEALLGPDGAAQHARAGVGAAAAAHDDGAAAHALADAVAGVAFDDDGAARHAEAVAGR